MAWVRIDDGMALHPKVLALSLEDRWRFVEVLLYCSRYRTDGRVSDAILTQVFRVSDKRTTSRITRRLHAAGLLDEDDEGWTVHDYLEYQPSREADDERRRAQAERVRRFRERRGKGGKQGDAGNADGNALQDASVTRSRARVDPTRPPRKGGGEGGDTTSRGRPPAAPRRAARSSSPARSSDLRALGEVMGETVNGSRTLTQVLTMAKAKAAARGAT